MIAYRLARAGLLFVLSCPIPFVPAQAQQLDLGHQMAPGYVAAPSPTFRGYEPSYQRAPAYQPAPSYQSSAPRYLPSYGGGVAGSTFNPR